jgi:arginine decarboxylase
VKSLNSGNKKEYKQTINFSLMRKWRIEDSAELYNINGWGINFFSINEKGHVTVTPKKNGIQVDLHELVEELQLRDVSAPMLLRFPDILDNRIEKMASCFKVAAEEYDYKAQNFIIYPIKVNQMRPVVEEIVGHGKKFNIGLEAGSKPELHAVIAINTDNDSLIICNGYKDEDYIELALLAQKMGRRIYLVVEKLNELKLIIKTANRLKVKPNLGIRIKLASSGSGKWEDSGGDASKFGLTSSELLEALDILEKKDMKDCLKLVHFHIGSQVTKIRRIKLAMREASQFYVQLYLKGFNVEFVDIGGGLGVDYDGTRSSSSESSVNYSIQEYVNDAIATMVDVSDKNNIPHPNIITESGRSLTAHHSVLIFEVLETSTLPTMGEEEESKDDDHELVRELFSLWEQLNQSKMLETWHDAQQIREEALDLFSLGHLDLKTRAQIERLFWSITKEIHQMTSELKHIPEELLYLPKLLSDKYFCNFSLFQSLPDSWAIDQIFPIIPIQRLDEKPDRSATIQDITCDSDGKIDNFISTRNFSYYLPVHALKAKEPYYMGVFLVGAYQEILGDLHNLFGDTNAVHISVDNKGYSIDQIIDGETVAEVLDYVQYNAKKLVRTVETWVTSSVKSGIITAEEGKEFLSNYRSGLYGYTYLE